MMWLTGSPPRWGCVDRGRCRTRIPDVRAVARADGRVIRLGLTRAAVLRLLGPAERDHDGVAEFEMMSERLVRTGGSEDRYDLFSALTVTFRDGRVVAFSGALGDTD